MYAVLIEDFGRSGETAVAEGRKVVICPKDHSVPSKAIINSYGPA